MRFCELREKEVVNVCNGQCLGFVVDLEIDPCKGLILALIIPGCGKMWSMFGRGSEVIIPWNQVVKIGADIILVDIPEPKPKPKSC
ncbi:YlmC/YmxH family sporulation protein [Lachnospiraceae bacterium 29-84]